ncbi:MAG: glycosyltransferase family 39 protein [Pseudomonadota bacterium]
MQQSPFLTASLSRRGSLILIAALVIWVAVLIIFAMPTDIVQGWMGWRQADTQSIALNYYYGDEPIWRPQVNWGGITGFVETEFPLYAWLASQWMHFFGPKIQTTQYLSLACAVFFVITIAVGFGRRYGLIPTAFAIFFILSSRVVVYLATSVQPDILSMALYTVGFFNFCKFLRTRSGKVLFVSTIASVLAVWTKPLALNLGIAQAILIFCFYPTLLKDMRIWLSWGVILSATSVWMLHARSLYLEFGNTFGVLSGGDSKLPTLEKIQEPEIWISLFKNILEWGVGLWSVPALLVVFGILFLNSRYNPVRTKIPSVIQKLSDENFRFGVQAIFALICASFAAVVLSIRYSHGDYGPHYHVWWILPAAWSVALSIRLVMNTRTWHYSTIQFFNVKNSQFRSFLCISLILFSMTLIYARAFIFHVLERQSSASFGENFTPLGQESFEVIRNQNLKNWISAEWDPKKPLLLVRSLEPSRDVAWNTEHNYEDPRLFYWTRLRGWVIPSDDQTLESLEYYAKQGASWYIEPNKFKPLVALHVNQTYQDDRWSMQLISDTANGRIYRLN